MSNPFYQRQAQFQPRTKAKSDQVRSELDAVQAGFEKLPTPTPTAEADGFTVPVKVGTATDPQHAATLEQLQGTEAVTQQNMERAQQAQSDAEQARNGAQLAEGNAGDQAAEAAQQVTLAAQEVTKAAGEVQNANQWAVSLVEVEPGFKGARGYAEDAASSAQQAQQAAAGQLIDDDATSSLLTWSSFKVDEVIGSLAQAQQTANAARYTKSESDARYRTPAVTDHGSVSSGTVTLDLSVSTKHRVTAAGAITLALTGWPASGSYGEIELELFNGGAHAITLPAFNWLLGDGTSSTSFADMKVTLAETGSNTLVFWSSDGGATICGVAG